MPLFRRNKQKLHTIELYDAGKILYRTDEFWRQTQMFIIPTQPEGQNESIAERISACFPKIISMSTLTSDDGRLYFTTDDWQAQLALIHTDADKSVYEFWFADPRSSADHQSFLQMNALSTAVEKAFLLTSINTLVVVQYVSADERAFKIGMAAAGTQVLDVIKWAKVTPFSVAMQAVRTGSKSITGLYDSDLVAQANKTMLSNEPTPLLSRFIGTPALPEKLRAAAAQETFPSESIPSEITPPSERTPSVESAPPIERAPSVESTPPIENAPSSESAPSAMQASSPKVESEPSETLLCRRCRHVNPVTSRFCLRCGIPLNQ